MDVRLLTIRDVQYTKFSYLDTITYLCHDMVYVSLQLTMSQWSRSWYAGSSGWLDNLKECCIVSMAAPCSCFRCLYSTDNGMHYEALNPCKFVWSFFSSHPPGGQMFTALTIVSPSSQWTPLCHLERYRRKTFNTYFHSCPLDCMNVHGHC